MNTTWIMLKNILGLYNVYTIIKYFKIPLYTYNKIIIKTIYLCIMNCSKN